MDFGKNLRRRREELTLRQDELAAEIGVTPQYISKLENNQATPSLEKLVTLSRVLGVSVDHLLTGQPSEPVDIRGALRGRPLSATTKRSLIQLIGELETSP